MPKDTSMNETIKEALKIWKNAFVNEDIEGQLIIHTGLYPMANSDGQTVKLDANDDPIYTDDHLMWFHTLPKVK